MTEPDSYHHDGAMHTKRSFFEENLASSERTSLKYGSPSPRGTAHNSPSIHQHVSQMSVGAGLTDCSEAEES